MGARLCHKWSGCSFTRAYAAERLRIVLAAVDGTAARAHTHTRTQDTHMHIAHTQARLPTNTYARECTRAHWRRLTRTHAYAPRTLHGTPPTCNLITHTGYSEYSHPPLDGSKHSPRALCTRTYHTWSSSTPQGTQSTPSAHSERSCRHARDVPARAADRLGVPRAAGASPPTRSGALQRAAVAQRCDALQSGVVAMQICLLLQHVARMYVAARRCVRGSSTSCNATCVAALHEFI